MEKNIYITKNKYGIIKNKQSIKENSKEHNSNTLSVYTTLKILLG